MRWIGTATLIAAGLWTWHVWEERRLAAAETEEGAPVVSAAPPTITPPAVGLHGWARGTAARTWWRLRGAPEPASDRLVHCDLGDEGEFLRRSECARRGGVVDEPDWARLDWHDGS